MATGFESQRPGGEWLEALIDWFGLTVAPCGYPIVNAQVRMGEGVTRGGGTCRTKDRSSVGKHRRGAVDRRTVALVSIGLDSPSGKRYPSHTLGRTF
ncbi:MAG UNVERIFIED_CONTAM: hypothetical protein LVT10_20250 [Anaerolineae bacterium]